MPQNPFLGPLKAQDRSAYMRVHLTVKAINAMKLAGPGTRYEVGDAIVPGFGVRVNAKGKSYILTTRFPGSPHPTRRTIAAVGEIKLAAARDQARAWLEKLKSGTPPPTVKQRVLALRRPKTDTFAHVAKMFLEQHVHRNSLRTAREVERIIHKDLMPAWRNREFKSIRRGDVARMLDAKEATAPVQADYILSVLSKLCNWYMDFVEGAPVTDALDARGASRAVRLDAFEAVGDAVAYAHRNLVIHADIKPSNVLMTGDGKVHLLDFGIARLIVGLDAEESGDPYPLTKGYAAPERGVGVAPTIASDVFSLGVLMLGMLGCAIPDADGNFVPGTRMPVGQLEGDLAAIAARALAERPEDRYPDVPAFLSDIRRHRAFVPVAAREGAGWRYVAGRFIWRHRKGLALTALAALALLATTAISTVQYFRAERARAEADARFDDARGTARYLLFDLMPKLENMPRALPLRVQMADVAQRYLDRLTRARNASDTVRFEAATGLWRLAQHQARAGGPNLSQPDRADANLRKADAIARLLRGNAAVLLRARISTDRVWLATIMQADLPGAAVLAKQMERDVNAARSLDPALYAEAQFVLADLSGWRGNFAEEYRIAATALAQLPPGESRDLLLARAHLIWNQAEATYYRNDAAGALLLYRQGLQLVERAYQNEPQDNYLLQRRVNWRWSVGTTLLELGRFHEGLDILRQGLADAEKAFAFDPADREARRNRRVLAAATAQALGFLKRSDEALVHMQAIVRDDEALLREAPGNTRVARDLALDHAMIGEALDRAGRRAEACRADRRALDLFNRLDRLGQLAKVDTVENTALPKKRIAKNCTSR